MTAQHKGFTRRQFTELIGGGALALFAGAAMGCAPKDNAARNSNDKVSKTVDCDVLVVGGGGAGVTAAGKAAEAGANTVLIEKMPYLAGSSSLALGTFYGAGTQLQKAAGIDDSPEGLLAYFLSRNGDKLDYDMQKFCAEHFGETIDWLTGELGVPFKDKVSIKGKDTVPRGHNCATSAFDALNAVTKFAHEKGVTFHFNMGAQELVMNGDEVAGVIAKDAQGTLVQYNAKQTIMASGGFCRNPDMIDQYMPDYSGVYTEVGMGLTGEGLRMGLDKGAAYVGHGGTNGILACPIDAGQSKLISAKVLWVDSNGQRFNNEGGQTHEIYYQVAHFPDQKFFAIYDQSQVDALPDKLKASLTRGISQGFAAKADTVEDACTAMGVNGSAAAATLAAYNAMAAAGVDTQFKKKADNLIPLTQAPFYVIQMGVCTHGSFGGYHVNTDFQVLDNDGKAIPRFYSAGEVCCGTFIYDDYPAGGCGLNWSYTSGRFAGANAAAAALA